MSVRQSLLAILAQGPCYGYQLRHEFDRRTGSVWPLNVGQIYNTLERLERDGLVSRGEADDRGHVYWRITDAGIADVDEWLSSPSCAPRAPGTNSRSSSRSRRLFRASMRPQPSSPSDRPPCDSWKLFGRSAERGATPTIPKDSRGPS